MVPSGARFQTASSSRFGPLPKGERCGAEALGSLAGGLVSLGWLVDDASFGAKEWWLRRVSEEHGLCRVGAASHRFACGRHSGDACDLIPDGIHPASIDRR